MTANRAPARIALWAYWTGTEGIAGSSWAGALTGSSSTIERRSPALLARMVSVIEVIMNRPARIAVARVSRLAVPRPVRKPPEWD